MRESFTIKSYYDSMYYIMKEKLKSNFVFFDVFFVLPKYGVIIHILCTLLRLWTQHMTSHLGSKDSYNQPLIAGFTRSTYSMR